MSGISPEDQEILDLFLEETRERIEAIEPALVGLEQAGSTGEREAILHDIFRHMHSTKGSASYLGLTDLVTLVHSAEQLTDALRQGAELRTEHVDLLLDAVSLLKAYLVALASDGEPPEQLAALSAQLDAAAAATSQSEAPAPDEPKADGEQDREQDAARDAAAEARPVTAGSDVELFSSTVRVPVDTLDRLGLLAEEMLVARNRITSLATTFQDLELTAASKKISDMVSELQDIAALTRLQPISYLFSQMPRIARDAARLTNKEVELTIEGGTLEIDRRILQELRDPLVHLLRNAVDHGIEPAQRRVSRGKPSKGHIRLIARREGSNLVVHIEDDGDGIDLEKVRAKAVERGLIGSREAAALSDEEVVNLLLRPGFSIRDDVTSLSGRGVGLDVVAVRMQELGGTLAIQATPGKGTRVLLTVPTSVSVVNTLVFSVRGYLLGLPYNFVQEIVLIDEQQVERYGDQEVFRLRDQLVPLFTLDSWADRRVSVNGTDKRYVLVLRNQDLVAGLWCDGIARFEELIVKPVGNVIRGVDIISGLASLGTGEIVLILEPEALLKGAGLMHEALEAHQSKHLRETVVDRNVDDFAERMILVRGYGEYCYALPVRLVSRIVQFNQDDLTPVGDRIYLRQEGRLIPLLDLDQSLNLGQGGQDGIALLIMAEGQQCALAAAEVVRIGPVSGQPEPSEHRFVVGLLNLSDGVYLLVDVPNLLHDQIRGFFTGQEAATQGLTGRHILVVEDSQLYRDSLRVILTNAGADVTAVDSVDQGLQQLAANPEIGLVITDYLLPGHSGLDFIQAIRRGAVPGHESVPILVLSQHVAESPEITERLRAAGANELLAKFDERDHAGLLALVRRLLDTGATVTEVGAVEEAHDQDEGMEHILSLNLGDEVYGIPIAQIVEITALDDLTPTPVDQSGYLGLANIRGEIVPVFDLGGALGTTRSNGGEDQVDVVVMTGLGPLVLRGDGIRGTVRVPTEELRVPSGNLGELAEYVPAVVTLSDCLLQLLDLERLANACLARR